MLSYTSPTPQYHRLKSLQLTVTGREREARLNNILGLIACSTTSLVNFNSTPSHDIMYATFTSHLIILSYTIIYKPDGIVRATHCQFITLY